MSKVQLQSTIDRITNWVLLVLGAIAGILGIAETIFDLKWRLDELAITLLGLIAMGLGLERLSTYKRVELAIERGANGIRLDTWEEVYGAATELVKTAKAQVRATVFGQGEWAGPDNYLKVIAKVAKSHHQAKRDFLYKAVFGYKDKPDILRAKHILRRYSIFKETGVATSHQMKHIETNWDLDMLIVDDRHLIIGFPQFQRHIRTGIKFIDQPELVKPITEWFDQQLWEKASEVDLGLIRKLVEKSM